MKKFVGFYYRCSFKVCLCAFLSLIGLMVLSSSAFAQQSEDFTINISSQAMELTPTTSTTTTTILHSGDFNCTVSDGTVTIISYSGTGGDVVIPDTIDGMPVVGIGGYYGGGSYYGAFQDRDQVTSVTIPDSVTSIGKSAFKACTGLTSVTIGNSVRAIGEYAFIYCSGLTSLTIGNSVTIIGSSAFYSCRGLTSVIIPNSVTFIGVHAFGGCSGLTSLTIGNSVREIASYAFMSCGGLTSVTIPASVTSIGTEAFSGCGGLTSIVVDASNTFYSSQDGVLYNKSKTWLIQYPVGKSGGFTIPDSVTSIGSYAFEICLGLTSVTIGNSVTSVGSYAFYKCYNLTSVIIPNSVTSIGESAFQICTGLTSVIIPNSVTSIGNWAFGQCYGLTSVIIPDSVTSIGGYAFGYCSGLTSVTIGNSVTSVGSYAFYKCYNLISVTIGNSVTSIGESAFQLCTGLTSIVVDANNTAYSSQDGVLYNKAMTVLIQYPGGKSGGFTIPNSVTSIGESAFDNCSGLTSVTIGNSVTSIRSNAFYNCTGLTSVTIGNSVTSIGESAFQSCTSLTSVIIPNSVTSIGWYAFWMCRGLTKAYFLGNAPSMVDNVFDYCSSNFSICYTAGATGFTTPTWKSYPAAVCEPPTVINLSFFTATPKAGKVILQWNTESETDNAGFNLYRSETEDGEYTQINTSLIPAQGSPTQGATYEFVDTDVKNRKTYYYKLEDIDLNGTSTFHGPVSATPRWIFRIFRK